MVYTLNIFTPWWGEKKHAICLSETSFWDKLLIVTFLNPNFARCRMNSFNKAAWITDSYRFSSSMHPRSENLRLLLHNLKNFLTLLSTLFLIFSLTNTSIYTLVAEARTKLASEHACIPLATGHWGFVTAAAEGGEIHSSSCADGAHPHHQACDP